MSYDKREEDVVTNLSNNAHIDDIVEQISLIRIVAV